LRWNCSAEAEMSTKWIFAAPGVTSVRHCWDVEGGDDKLIWPKALVLSPSKSRAASSMRLSPSYSIRDAPVIVETVAL
jgi:hypothetical protein